MARFNRGHRFSIPLRSVLTKAVAFTPYLSKASSALTTVATVSSNVWVTTARALFKYFGFPT
jgi:hypothetical protein